MKQCSKCKDSKPESAFCKDASRYDGLHPWCRDCRSTRGKSYYQKNKQASHERTAKWRQENQERVSEINRKSHQNNKEKRNAYSREYRQENLEHMRKLGRDWSKNNPDKARALNARRRAAKAKATPVWSQDEFESFAMGEIYDLAIKRTEITGIAWHVDHIVPLRSKRVCGLHCVANLQVIPGEENYRKGNRVWPNM